MKAQALAHHDRFADERWSAHLDKHDGERELSATRWTAHDNAHASIARNLAEYKVASNEWRATLSDFRSQFAPLTSLNALDSRLDAVREELRGMIVSEREERRDQQTARVSQQKGVSQTVAVALAVIGLAATILSIVVLSASILK